MRRSNAPPCARSIRHGGAYTCVQPLSKSTHVNFKRRGNRISLYRSTWVPKGPGVPHGYTCQSYVGSILADATTLPPELAGHLSPIEGDALERKVLAPARAEKEASIRLSKAREADPSWRIDEALRLVNEAADKSQGLNVSASRVQALKSAVEKVKTFGAAPPSSSTGMTADPLRDAHKAIASAAEAVRQGRYGRAPSSGFRKTTVFKQWTEILAAIDAGERSLLRSLQDMGYATRRKR